MQKKSLLIIVLLVIFAIVVAYIMFGVERQTETTETGPLNIPGADATVQERQTHFELAFNASRATGVLDITGCNPDPEVLRVKNGEFFDIKNEGSTEHILIFDEDRTYRIPANSTVSLEANFGRGNTGLYGYGCDFSSKASGLIFVE